ncbi:unnamed protein product, partial [Pylaiella littoralis]
MSTSPFAEVIVIVRSWSVLPPLVGSSRPGPAAGRSSLSLSPGLPTRRTSLTVISLVAGTTVRPSGTRPDRFVVDSGKRTVTLQAADVTLRNAWVAAIRDVLRVGSSGDDGDISSSSSSSNSMDFVQLGRGRVTENVGLQKFRPRELSIEDGPRELSIGDGPVLKLCAVRLGAATASCQVSVEMQNPGSADSGNRCSACHRGGQARDFRHTRPRTGKKNMAFVDEAGIVDRFPGLQSKDLSTNMLALCKREDCLLP